jgi:hypothetical protein
VICECSACQESASETVTVWKWRAPETRHLCARHAAELRAEAKLQGWDRDPGRWLKDAPPVVACTGCRRVVGESIKGLCGALTVCEACYRRERRKEKRQAA